MADRALVEYAKQQLQAGYSRTQVIEAILDSPDYSIDEAYDAVEEAETALGSSAGPPASAASPVPSSPPPSAGAPPGQPVPSSRVGSLLSLLGGIGILLNGTLALAAPDLFTNLGITTLLALFGLSDIVQEQWMLLSALTVMFGILVIASVLLVRKHKPRLGATLVILPSLLSFVFGVGILIGSLLGLIGGVLVLLKK